jgi:Protein of unknown function (DUF3313)
MRAFLLAAVSAAALCGANAFAAPVTLAPVSFSPEFQESLSEDLGAREGEYLRRDVLEEVSEALTRRGATIGAGSGLSLEISIVDADPNRPTMAQLSDRPGLDMHRSLSIGGAELRGVLRDAQGEVVQEITHRRYNHSIDDVSMFSPTTWSEAQRSIRQFAEKVADAYVAAAN